MSLSSTIDLIADKVKVHLIKAEGGHDWFHIQRVWYNAKVIGAQEDGVDEEIISLATLLHDIADPKFHNGDETIGPRIAREWLEECKVPEVTIAHIVNIIKHMSFKNSLDAEVWTSPELKVVQDADRLDAIGAIGIARAFNYGGHKDRAMFDPEIAPALQMTKEEYKKSAAPTINHFYEKLLKLKSMMNTKTGIKMAVERHDYMVAYLEQFYKECGLTPSWHQV